jgi:hypothetical protein
MDSALHIRNKRRRGIRIGYAMPKGATVPGSRIYCDLMEEVKSRLDAIREIVIELHKEVNPRPFVLAESGFLQLRFVCELIALACVGIHESLGLGPALLKSWNAGRIFDDLRKVHPLCFPRPASVNSIDGTHHVHVHPAAIGMEDLQQVYGRCGDILHRGVLKHMLAGKERVYDINILHKWASEIGRLLTCHIILVPAESGAYVVNLTGGPDSSVQLIKLAADGPFATADQWGSIVNDH